MKGGVCRNMMLGRVCDLPHMVSAYRRRAQGESVAPTVSALPLRLLSSLYAASQRHRLGVRSLGLHNIPKRVQSYTTTRVGSGQRTNGPRLDSSSMLMKRTPTDPPSPSRV